MLAIRCGPTTTMREKTRQELKAGALTLTVKGLISRRNSRDFFALPLRIQAGMSKQQNIETQKAFGEAVNTNNLGKIADLMSPGVIDHDPAPDQGPGPEGFIQFFTAFREAFPDLAIDVEHLTADEDSVAIAYTVTGTHRGEFQGVPASGRRIQARGVQIARFEDGLIVERWGSSDQLGILEQIGEPVLATQ